MARISDRWFCRGAAVALLAVGGNAMAVGLAIEQFRYPAGTVLPGMALGTGWSAPWIGSLMMAATPPPPAANPALALPPLGNALLNSSVGEGWRPLSGGGGGGLSNAGNDVWVSFWEMSSAAGPSAFVSLDPAGPGFPNLFVNKDPLGTYSLITGGLPAVAAGLSNGPGQWDFVVVQVSQFSGGFTTVRIWLNPAVALTPLTASATVIVPGTYLIGRFYYRSNAGEWLDEIIFGTLPGDVAAGLGGGTCYANCDQSTVQPCLTVADFGCFLNRYAAGDAYANCDGSTTPPILNVGDFACYLNRYAAGCSGC